MGGLKVSSGPFRLVPALVASLSIALAVSATTAAMAVDPLVLLLPESMTIKLVNGRTISGVRLVALRLSTLIYEQAGQRQLPLRQVQSISFAGLITLEAKKDAPPLRGIEPKDCRGPRQLLLARGALVVQPKGAAMAVNAASLSDALRKDLQETSTRNLLVVNSLRFDPLAKVRIGYKTCSPGQLPVLGR